MSENENLEVETIETSPIEGLSETEQKAHAAGWRPQTEWEGNPEDWVNAKEYLRVGEMMDRIKSQGSQLRSYTKKLDQLESALKQLGEHNKKIQEKEYNKAMRDLKAMKAQALEQGDYETVVEIDERLADYREVDPAKAPQIPETTTNPVIETWMEENQWYEQDAIMRGAADAMMHQLRASQPALTADQILASVSETMKEEFPHKFGGTKGTQTRRTTVEPNMDGTARARTTQSKAKYTSKHLNEMQLKTGKTFVRTGAIESLEEYAKQLADLGELDIQKGGA